MNDIISKIKDMGLTVKPVGSRVTCNPPPTDTDEDYLIHCDPEQFADLIELLEQNSFTYDGSKIDDGVNFVPENERFQSYSYGYINLIITSSLVFYRRFLAASSVAKKFNLLNKKDRIMLFQAVLYANVYNDDHGTYDNPVYM